MAAVVADVAGPPSGLRFAFLAEVRVVGSGQHANRRGVVTNVAGSGPERRWLVVLDSCVSVWIADDALEYAS